MDPVPEIKARLPIDELVRQYTQITKKGRNFVSLCPFHNDTHPSFLISPDKGIAYCFACQKGGDIFSVYQLLEGVDFPQAIRELAEKVGVALPDKTQEVHTKDERERLRDCLESADVFFRRKLNETAPILEYLEKRGVTESERELFAMGFAPDSFTETYDYLLKAGFSRKEIVAAGLGVQKDIQEDRIYDRFRNRLMFPIADGQGRIVGFGGRTMGNDDAKYVNNSESLLYRKSSVLFGLHLARDGMRESKQAIVVEGYFDVLACHRMGRNNVVATCGTALTEEHAKILKRYTETAVLCFDSDRAGRDAAERAFQVCAREGLLVQGIMLTDKDPADAALTDPDGLKSMLEGGGEPYTQLVLQEIRGSKLSDPKVRHEALARVMTLMDAIPDYTEGKRLLKDAATAFGSPESEFEADFRAFKAREGKRVAPVSASSKSQPAELFSGIEVALGMLLLYPQHLGILPTLTKPEDGFALALYDALSQAQPGPDLSLDSLALSDGHRMRAGILQLYCEKHDFGQWSETLSEKGIANQIATANNEERKRRLAEISRHILDAQRSGNVPEAQAWKDKLVDQPTA